MTRYRLAARSIAYCPRRGLLPVAPRPAPIGLRLLSQTRVTRAEDNNSSGNKPPAPPSSPSPPSPPGPPQPSKPENEPPTERKTAAPSTPENEDTAPAVPQPPKPVDANPTSETPVAEASTPAAESSKQVSGLPAETNVAPPAEPARASEAKVPVPPAPATLKKEKPKPKGGKELKAWLKQREKEGIMRAVDIASAVRSERAEEAQKFREEREAFYKASEEATKHVTVPESGILNPDQFKEVLKVPAPPVPKRPAILAQPMSRGRRKWTERYHKSRKQMGLWPYDGIPAHRKSPWDRMLRKMGMKRKNIFRERGPTRRITGQKPKVFVQEPVRDFIRRAMDPERSTIRWAEWAMMKKGIQPIGSRRRRAAIRTSPNIPFEHMPYQCFQEALKILRADREEKFQALVKEEARLQRLVERDPSEMKGGLAKKQGRIQAHKAHIEKMTILVDINDPLVKRKSEDGLGDMDKPIYRKLARERWESYDKKIIAQRINQFKVVPDLLPGFDPTAAVELRWQRKTIAPGTKMACQDTEFPPALKVQVFDAGPRLVTVAVVDSDVPDPENDTFTSRCHFIATNIPLSPNKPNITIRQLNPSAIAVPWLPPFAQRGTNYHRLSIVVLEQESPYPLDVSKLTATYSDGGTQGRNGFSLRSFRDKFNLRPIGYNIFRTQWDDGTAEVMAKYNIPGADIEFKRKRDPRIKPLRKRKGWEAKRQGPKYRELWKYTKRIRGWNDKKWRNSKMERKYRN